jgi:hypothetical protein
VKTPRFTQNSRLITQNARAARQYFYWADIKGAALDWSGIVTVKNISD